MKDFQDLVLKAIYSNLNNITLYQMSLNNLRSDKLLKSISNQEFFKTMELLENRSYLTYRENVIDKEDYIISVNLKGILKYEEDHLDINREFTELTQKFLNSVKKIEEKIIKLEPGQLGKIAIETFLRHSKIDEKDFDKLNFIRHNGDNIFHRNIGWTSKDGFIFYGKDFIFLTPKGREFLEFQNKLKNLFRNVSNKFGKKMVLEEYQDIHFLIEHNKWKDILIKMGSIIEYLITDYIEYSGYGINQNGNLKEYNIKDHSGNIKKIKPLNAKFREKLSFIIQKNIFGSNWTSDWIFVDNNIREFRNYVHLTKVIYNNLIVDKVTVQKVYPVFEKIITLF